MNAQATGDAFFAAEQQAAFEAEVADYEATDRRERHKEELGRILDIIHVQTVQLDKCWDTGKLQEAEALLNSRQFQITLANYLLGRIINAR